MFVPVEARRRKKILHLITTSVRGGAQDNTFCTAERHVRERFEVHIACNPDGPWLDRARQAGDVFHPLPLLVSRISPWKDLRGFISIVMLLWRERFDLIHTHTSKAGFLGRLAACLCRVPCVVHTYHAFPFHDYMPRWRYWFYLILERGARLFTDYFITLSNNDRCAGERFRILRNPARAIYTGIDLAKIDRAADPAVTRAQLEIPDDWQVIMTAGRLEPQKAPDLLVAAFHRVVQAHPKTILLLAGDGELRTAVEAQVAGLNLGRQVRFLGFRNDVPDLLRASDIFVFSSRWEAMGRAMVEAMLMGKPVVVPSIYGIPEIVRHGETGFLYPVGQVDQLAAQLISVLASREQRELVGRKARALTRPLFDLGLMVEQIEEVYTELLCARTESSGWPVRSAPAPISRAAA